MTPTPPLRPRRVAPTMADVAERAGVSTMTVSRALRKGASISEDARRRIMQAVDELGYVLDQSAGTLSSKRSGFAAALIPSLNSSNFSDTARGITEAIEGAGLQLLLGYTDYLVEKEERLIEAMLRRRPEGIVISSGEHNGRVRRLVAAAGIPVVEVWDLPREPIEHVVGFSNSDAVRALTHHLHGRGYREIGFIGGTSGRDTRGSARREGYLQAVAELDLPRGRLVSHGLPPMSMEQGREAIVEMIEAWPKLDAVICVSDLAAFGALMECHRRGWAVPGRIAIAGFGDFEVGRCAFPAITTISVDPLGIGRAAGDLLLRAIEAARSGTPLPAERVLMPFRVEQREST